LADLQGYIDAHQKAADRFGTPDEWWRSAVLNTARGGRFSSDRAIQEYADRIWRVKSVPAKR
ncbi:MAG TPA: hypothetical protein DCG14_06450, partial [Phycisphaerales bacterium]|nr:hypothetical protein [Phycisphaerales bacterium]